jgi:flagellar biosynthesis protein FlhG
MSAALADQAQGLRTMFARPPMAILPVVAGAEGAGKTTVATHLAHAAAKLGKRVSLLDASRGDVPAALGLTARYELIHMLQGMKSWDDVALPSGEGVTVVPAARGFATLSRDTAQGAHLFNGFAKLDPAPDLLVLNLPPGPALTASLLDPEGDVLVVVTPRPESLTAAYATVKRIAFESGTRRLRVLVNRAATPEEARQVHANFTEAARRFLAIDPEFAGLVANEPAVGVARRSRRTVFDAEPLSGAATSFMRLAQSIDGWSLARCTPQA